jgi:hypothetical protein
LRFWIVVSHPFLKVTTHPSMDLSYDGRSGPNSCVRILTRGVYVSLRLHLLSSHNVRILKIEPYPFEDAYVGFNSPLERRFLNGPPLSFYGYSVHFVKHDEGGGVW